MIKNLTPHPVTILAEDRTVVIPPSGIVARVQSNVKRYGMLDGVPITHTSYTDIIDLPEPEAGTLYITSCLVAQACPKRTDVLFPNEIVRDESKRVIGCKSLGRI